MSPLGILRTLIFLPLLFLPASEGGQREARSRLIARDYQGAIELLDKMIEEKSSDSGAKGLDRLRYFVAQARLLAGRRDEAEKGFRELLKKHPQSSYRSLAQFGLLETLEGNRSFQEAAEIYQKAVTGLLSPERRAVLAENYLQLVQEALAKQKPDRGAAIGFLDLALSLQLPAKMDQRLREQAARLAFEGKDWKQAGRRYEALVKAERGQVYGKGNGKPATELRFQLARSWARGGDRASAQRILEDLLREELTPSRIPEVLLELAKSFGPPAQGASLSRGVDILGRILREHPDYERAAEVAYTQSQWQGSLGRLEAALDSIGTLESKYAKSQGDWVARAAADRGLYLGRLKRFEEAIHAWRDYLNRFPAHGRWMQAQRAIVDLELQAAAELKARGKEHYPQASQAYRSFLMAHPLDSRSSGIYLTLASMQIQLEKWDEAKKIFAECASKYPGRNEASEAAYRMGEILETRLGDYPGAIAAYTKVPGAWAGRARQRLVVLRKKSLQLQTERIFHTGEKAQVLVTTRNIPSLRLRIYKLDLVNFFQGTLGKGRIENLAIEAISPDKSFDSKVEQYQKYQETRRGIEIPFEGPGAYVVKVDDGTFEATTLVLVTDLAVISKTSRKELFVFAQNTRENRALPGAKIIVTDGKKIIAEGKTDAKGSYRFSGKEVGLAKRLHVLASTDKGSAASTLDLSGLFVSQGLQAKAFVYTDRGLYLPGSEVHARAVLRDAASGRYRIPEDKNYRMEWVDPSGRLLGQEVLELSPFGTLEAAFHVPGEGGQGNYSLRVVRVKDGAHMGQGQVKVGFFQTPRVSVKVVTEQRVILRGEKIEGRVEARYFFGGPVRDRAVIVQASIAGRTHILQGRTDEAGGYSFSFDTDRVLGDQTLVVNASIPSEQAFRNETWFLRQTAFDLSLELPSSIYVVGEDFEAKATVRGFDGKLLSRDLDFELYRTETVGGIVREIPVARKETQSLVEKGVALAGFPLVKGGQHRLRVFAKDRFGNTIEKSLGFFVSGEDDKIKLRLLSRVQHSKVGDELVVRVLNRAGPKLCLLSYEGDGVLSFESKVFPKGETTYRIPLKEEHAPNFQLALSMVDGKWLHQASRHFFVDRPLEVEIQLDKKRVLPGGKLSVIVKATDTRGKPVQAEFSLALVDAALLQIHADESPSLYEVFYGPSIRRSLAMKTQSSCTFQYRARTMGVNTDIQKETASRRRSLFDKKLKESWASDDFTIGRGAKGADKADRARVMTVRGNAELAKLNDRLEQLEKSLKPGQAYAQGVQGRYKNRPGQPLQRRFSRGIGGGAGGGMYRGPGNMVPPAISGGVFYVDGGDGRFAGRSENFFTVGLAQVIEGKPLGDPGRAAPRASKRSLSVWVGSVQTDAQGMGTIQIDLPDKSGRWKLRARGVSADHLFGEAKAEVETAKEIIVQPGLPGVLTEGDEVMAVLTLHNLGLKARSTQYSAKLGDAELVSGTSDVPAQGSLRVPLPISATTAGTALVEAQASSKDGQKDSIRLPVVIRPWSLQERAGVSGMVNGKKSMSTELPAGTPYRDYELQIDLGPEAPDAFLVQSRPGLRGTLNQGRLLDYLPATQSNRAAMGLAALSFYRYLKGVLPAEKGRLARLRNRVQTVVAAIQSMEQKGELTWIGKKGAGDTRASLLGWLFLEQALAEGFTVDANVLGRFRNRLSRHLRSRDSEEATLAFLDKAVSGQADFARFNSLYRNRTRMDLGSRSRLVLAALVMKRPELAKELTETIAGEVAAGMAQTPRASEDRKFVPTVRVEPILWGLLALSKSGAHPEISSRGETWLWSRRRACGWANGMATALAVEFLASRSQGPARVASEVTLIVNDKFRKAYSFKDDPSYRSISIATEHLVSGKNKIRIETSGAGSILYSATLTARTLGMPESRLGQENLRREYLQAQGRLDGLVLAEGFRSVEGLKPWKNLATALRLGESLRVRVHLSPTREMRRALGSYVVEEPLPGGAMVLKDEVTGNFDSLEMGRGFLRAYFSGRKADMRLDYVLRGAMEGRYRVLPTRLLSIDNPGYGFFGKSALLRIVGAKGEIKDERKATPDELYARGTRLFDRLDPKTLATSKTQRDEARRPLETLFTEYGKHLRARHFNEVARRLLTLSLIDGAYKRTVELFEALKDRDSAYQLGFDDMAKVGLAYYKSGEFEQSVNIYEAISEAAFLREAQIAGTLDRMGRLKDSVAFMDNLFLSFPGLPMIRTSMYGLAQKLNLKADELEKARRPRDPKVGSPMELRRKARDLCYEFLQRHPDDADADEVTFTLASVAIEADQYDEALSLLQGAVRAYPESTWMDDFLYLTGYTSYLKGQHDAALAMLERVATEDFPQGSGRRGPSESKWLAIFLQGQIHHAQGQPALALASYKKVLQRFTEAKEASNYFESRRLTLPEVTLVLPEAKSQVKLEWRNLERVEITVYKVDLMRLYLMRKSLSDMGKVQLFGIAPSHRETLKLTEGVDYRDHDRKLELPLEEAGAYLVIARSGELRSSGLLLRTDLSIDAQELPGEERIRVNVKQKGRFLPKADVKVVGAVDGRIRSGKTDLRGVFVADGLRGKATVLVKQGDDYAFYQSKSDFGGRPALNRKAQSIQVRNKADFNALKGNRALNFFNQQKRSQQIQDLLQNAVQGVEIRKTK